MILFLVPVLVGALRPPDRWGTRPSRQDLPLFLAAVLITAFLSGCIYARFHLYASGVVTSDFSQYCGTMELARRLLPNTWSPQRSYFVGLLLSPLSRLLGLEDGLFAGALLGTAGALAGIYLWSWAVAGRTAALASMAFYLLLGPLVVLPRTLSFYPELCGGMALLAGTTAMAIRRRSLGWYLAAALLLAVAPLLDLKALVWMLPSAAALIGLAFWQQSLVQTTLRLVSLVALLLVSWKAGAQVWPGAMRETLEEQMAAYLGDVGRRADLGNELGVAVRNPEICGYALTEGFIWGTSNPLRIPDTLRCIQQLRATVPAEALNTPDLRKQQKTRMDPLLPLLGAAGILGIAGLGFHALRHRNPARLLALLLPLPPYLLALLAAYQEEPAVRRLSLALLFAPVALGTAWTVLYRWRSAFARYSEVPRGEHGTLLPDCVLALALLLVATGSLNTPLAPRAQLPLEDDGSREWLALLEGRQAREPVDRLCGDGHAEDVRQGRGIGFRKFYGLK